MNCPARAGYFAKMSAKPQPPTIKANPLTPIIEDQLTEATSPPTFRNPDNGQLVSGHPYQFQPGNKAAVREPARKTLRDYLIEELDSPFVWKNGKKSGHSKWWGLARAWVGKALAGSERAQAELRDTIEGRPLQRQEISGVDGQPVMIAAGGWWPALSEQIDANDSAKELAQLAPPDTEPAT